MLEWIRFGVTAFFLLAALVCFAIEVLGLYRFGFVMNRMHAAGVGDTLALFCVIAGLAVASGPRFATLKLFLILLFMWFTSPVSTHFLSQVEYYTNRKLDKYVRGPFRAESGMEGMTSGPGPERSGEEDPSAGSRPGRPVGEETGESDEEEDFLRETLLIMEAAREERRKGGGDRHGIDGNH